VNALEKPRGIAYVDVTDDILDVVDAMRIALGGLLVRLSNLTDGSEAVPLN
jgi:hypothetical protein